ncbi:uncharacterized protein LOC143287036 [Babylonia areolata]|uniref:uncharacterized protein LOC143287036 n=1 Tax=Babylonia areolata TaxID=304850 RepID=UPI003FCF6715
MAAACEGAGAEVSQELTQAVQRAQWEEVLTLVGRPDCDQQQRDWAVGQTVAQAPEWFVDDNIDAILSFGSDDGLRSVFLHLLNRCMWECVDHVLKCNISATQHTWAVEQASRHADDFEFIMFIIPHCHGEELEQVLTHLVSRGLWESVDKVLERGVSTAQHRWAVEQASRHADDVQFRKYILPHCHDEELEQVLTHLVSRGLWEPIDSAAHSDVSVKHHILSHLVSQGQLKAVGRFLQRDIGTEQHRWAVEQASRHADNDEFIRFILPHCRDEELEQVLTHLVSRGLWESVDKVLERGVSTAQHRWAVEQASRHGDDHNFVHHILPHYHDEELEQVLTHLVSQGLWEPIDSAAHSDVSVKHHILSHLVSQGEWEAVGRFLQRDIGTEQHRWAVEQASRHADDFEFIRFILPHCHDEELEQVLTHLVSRGLWESVDKVLERGVSTAQHRWAVEQASRHADDDCFVVYILPHYHDEELEQVLTHLVSRGLWELVDKVLEQGVSTEQHRWAVEQASRHADDDCFVVYILPHYHDEELEQVLTHLVSRGLWEPIDSAAHSDVSVKHHILSHLVSQGQWEAVGRFLQRDIGTAQHRWAVEQASRRDDDNCFVVYILPHCHDEELEQVLTHLVSRGLWRSVGKVLERGVSTAQHRWAVSEAAEQAEDIPFHHFILCHCSEDDTVTFLPSFVMNQKWKCIGHMLCDVARDTLSTWITSGHDSRVHDALFWRFLHHCHVDVSLALDLTTAVTGISYRYDMSGDCSIASSVLAWSVPWQTTLCESLMMSLLHTLCYVMCSDDKEYTHSTEHTKQCVSDIYSHIIACIKDNTDSLQHNTLTTIRNKQKWTSVFTEIADTHKTDPLFLLHFLQGLNLYHVSRRGKNDDAMFLVVLAVFPLFPQLQSVALKMMVHQKRWGVIMRACLSHVWEHDRRQLFKAAVEQRQWSVVRQWSDHTVHDDDRDWVMKEAFKEKEWEVFLLLADHGLTPPEQMQAHFKVAKHGDWDTVLDMVERGGDITEVSELLENWATGNLRRGPTGDDARRYIKRCEKLIRLRLRFAKNSALSPRKALARCKWGSVLFNILHQPTEDYFSQVLHRLIAEREWHILMHLVRLGMNRDERSWLFPDMVRQQQWGVCRKLLEHGVDDQLCLEALPELLERNQWILVARVMEYNVDDAVLRQVMQCAFQRREGALFRHCPTLMKDKACLSTETQDTLFHQAISRDIWQAVKPMMVRKDSPVIRHRDVAFLKAIDHHMWDVVDFCQLHKADINMKDENGETPLNREARKEEWRAVQEIVLRDGQPNLLDMFGVSVLNRLIDHKQWDIVKLVIKFGGNIHLAARYSQHDTETYTPLQALIDGRQMDIIQMTVLWCGDQKKGVNKAGETTLHAACDSDRWDVMEDLMVRRVDPLALNRRGQSPLVYAVLNRTCPERTVAECCKLGFSSHQPSVTGPQESVLKDITRTVFNWCLFPGDRWLRFEIRCGRITSPLVYAVLRDSPVLVRMLCESGACSSTELRTLCTQLPRLTDRNTEEGRVLYEEVRTWGSINRSVADNLLQGYNRLLSIIEKQSDADKLLQGYNRLPSIIEKQTALMREVVSTPRTLQSSCRLMISHRFHYSDKRRRPHLGLLPIPEPLKNYVEYSDLCDPDYGKDQMSESEALRLREITANIIAQRNIIAPVTPQ